MNQKERMLAGLPYKAWLDGLPEERQECRRKLYRLNQLPPEEYGQIPALLKELFGKTGEQIFLELPFRCDFGSHIEVGENFIANYNLTILDVARVKIGRNVMIAPNVSIYTAGHPLHPDSRNSGYEYGIPITIGDNVRIAAGAVVLDAIPENSTAVGVPARVVRRNGAKIVDLDQVHIPDPVAQELCRLEHRIALLEAQLGEKAGGDAPDPTAFVQ